MTAAAVFAAAVPAAAVPAAVLIQHSNILEHHIVAAVLDGCQSQLVSWVALFVPDRDGVYLTWSPQVLSWLWQELYHLADHMYS